MPPAAELADEPGRRGLRGPDEQRRPAGGHQPVDFAGNNRAERFRFLRYQPDVCLAQAPAQIRAPERAAKPDLILSILRAPLLKRPAMRSAAGEDESEPFVPIESQ